MEALPRAVVELARRAALTGLEALPGAVVELARRAALTGLEALPRAVVELARRTALAGRSTLLGRHTLLGLPRSSLGRGGLGLLGRLGARAAGWGAGACLGASGAAAAGAFCCAAAAGAAFPTGLPALGPRRFRLLRRRLRRWRAGRHGDRGFGVRRRLLPPQFLQLLGEPLLLPLPARLLGRQLDAANRVYLFLGPLLRGTDSLLKIPRGLIEFLRNLLYLCFRHLFSHPRF